MVWIYSMNKFLLPVLATTLLALPAVANPVWQLVGNTQNSQVFVDKTSVVKRSRGNQRFAWYTSRVSFSQPTDQGWKEMVFVSSANCTSRLQRQRAVVVFDQTGEEIGRTEDGDKAKLVAPPRNSAAAIAMRYACQ